MRSIKITTRNVLKRKFITVMNYIIGINQIINI